MMGDHGWMVPKNSRLLVLDGRSCLLVKFFDASAAYLINSSSITVILKSNRGGSVIIRSALALVIVLPLASAAPSARANEGMWTFDNFPSSLVKQKYNVN